MFTMFFCPNIGRVSTQFPPARAARSTMTVPALIAATASEVIRRGDRRPGIAAVQMTMSTSFKKLQESDVLGLLDSAELSFA